NRRPAFVSSSNRSQARSPRPTSGSRAAFRLTGIQISSRAFGSAHLDESPFREAGRGIRKLRRPPRKHLHRDEMLVGPTVYLVPSRHESTPELGRSIVDPRHLS